MIHYYIICRSLTCAQRMKKVLEQANILTGLLRTPTAADGNGCSYSLKIAEGDLPHALPVLKNAGFSAERVLMKQGSRDAQEVQRT